MLTSWHSFGGESKSESRPPRIYFCVRNILKHKFDTGWVQPYGRFKEDGAKRGWVPAVGSRALRLLIVPREADPRTRFYGVFTEHSPPGKPWRYLFTPIRSAVQYPVRKLMARKGQGDYELTLIRPVTSRLERVVLGPDRVVAGPARFVIGAGGIGTAWFYFDEWLAGLETREQEKWIDEDPRFAWVKKRLKDGVISQAQAIQDAKSLMEVYSSYPMKRVRRELERKEITPDQALEEAKKIRDAYRIYFDLIKDIEKRGDELSMDFNLALIEPDSPTYPIFESIETLLDGSYQQEPGYRILSEQAGKPLNVEQVSAIFDLEHYRKMAFIRMSSWFSSKKTSVEPVSEDVGEAELVEDLKKDPFVQKLIQLRDDGQLSQARFFYYMMENVDRRVTLRQLEIAGAQQLRWANGRYLNVPVELKALQAGMLEEIVKK